MATTPAFAFMGQGTSSATVAARVTPAAASGTTAAPTTTIMTTATSAASGAGVTSSSLTSSGNNGSTMANTTIPVTAGASSAYTGGVILGASTATPTITTTTTTATAGGGTIAPTVGTAGQTLVYPSARTAHTATLFTPARPTTSNFWGVNASNNPSSDYQFGRQAVMRVAAPRNPPPGPGRFFNNFATRPAPVISATQPATLSAPSVPSVSVMPLFTTNNSPSMPQRSCTKEIRFRFEWSPDNISILLGTGFTQQFRTGEGDVDTFQCSLLQTPEIFKLTVDFSPNHRADNQSWLQTVSVYTIDHKRLTTVSVFWPGVRLVHCSWPKADTTLVKNEAGRYGIDVVLSSEKTGIKFSTTTSTTYTDHCDSLLGKMLDDPSSYDVYFEFDPPEHFTESEMGSFSETGSIEKMEAEDEGYQQQHQDDDGTEQTIADKIEQALKDTGSSSTSLLDTEKLRLQIENIGLGHEQERDRTQNPEQDGGADSNATTKHPVDMFMKNLRDAYSALNNISTALNMPSTSLNTTSTARMETLGAHKIVLSQYEYFKTMFSSSFAEGGPGIKRIKIKDSDIHCFQLLIQFLYLGRLRSWNAPTVLTQDSMTQRHQPSWEDVYLIADRYNIPDLKDMAGTRIVHGLCSEWAVPFLFRTGYLFEDMRQALVKFVVKNNMDEISHKKTQEAYFSHPECTAIFGEIIAELWSSKSN
ncbi:hypothetical protein BGX29_006611 [Mortierella sp. GBA35]|nr:hypothetical protein BGX29_006611 [Mortierella sp. GBA35]